MNVIPMERREPLRKGEASAGRTTTGANSDPYRMSPRAAFGAIIFGSMVFWSGAIIGGLFLAWICE